jgi:hypothetical protein
MWRSLVSLDRVAFGTLEPPVITMIMGSISMDVQLTCSSVRSVVAENPTIAFVAGDSKIEILNKLRASAEQAGCTDSTARFAAGKAI